MKRSALRLLKINKDLLLLTGNELDIKYVSTYTFRPDAYKTAYLWPFKVQFTNNCIMGTLRD
jgi:hypothetical protein